MDLKNEDLDDLNPRELGFLIELAGDKLHEHEDSTESLQALGDVTAEVGHKIIASTGGRVEY